MNKMPSAEQWKLPPDTHTVALGVADLNGILRGKRISAANWSRVCEQGSAVSLAALAMDMTSDIWDTPYANFSNGYPDMHILPMLPPVAVPWEQGVAFCMGRTQGTDHAPVPIDPRGALEEQVRRAADMGVEVKCGTELEFYLLDPETLAPKDTGIQVYSLDRASEMEHVLGPIRRQINEIGIPIEQSNPEYAPGQVEVNIRYGEALASSDMVVMFRAFVKDLARQYGYLATFMAKPFIDQSGSGFHVHYSLWRDGVNLFADKGRLNKLGMQFLAGLQERMAELSLVGSTTPNAFRRRDRYSFCPINNTWGFDNRTLGLRVVEGADHAVRIEKRDASADCNPYYLLACDIAAGLDGVEQEAEPTAPCLGDGYADETAESLPSALDEAVYLAKESDLITRVLGQERKNILIQQAEREIDFVSKQVTPVELARYIRNF